MPYPQGTQFTATWDAYFDNSMVFKDLNYKVRYDGSAESRRLYVEKHYSLSTAGRPGSTQKNLFLITASARAYRDENDTEGYNVAATNILIGNFGSLAANGQLWIALSDNTNIDVTPVVPGCKKYEITSLDKTKYTITIGLATSTTNANLSTCVPEVCVGQQVTFTLNGLPTSSISNMVGSWTMPTNFVDQPQRKITYVKGTSEGFCVTNYLINTALLANTSQAAGWIVNTNGNHVSIGLNLQFTSGQYVTVAAKGNFSAIRPQVACPTMPPQFQQIIPMLISNVLELGDGLGSGDVRWGATITSKPAFPGQANWTQLVNRWVSVSAFDQTGLEFFLDTQPLYNDENKEIVHLPNGVIPQNTVFFVDNPGISVRFYSATIADYFKTYLMFKPCGPSDIWVSLGVVKWAWGAYGSSGSPISSPWTTQPYYQDTCEMPDWSDVLKGHGF